MWQKIKNSLKALPLVVIILVSFSLRFINLGYSDYQGDEIKALFIREPDESMSEFLLNQRKGPGQFFVTYLIKLVSPTYSNELLSRFPFAFAGGLAVFFFYKLVELHFGKKVAFYASFFFATNGFFVALSRIVQYQSFVIMLMIAALYYFSLALNNERYKVRGIYLGFILWALSMLFHYDGILIAPFAIYLVFSWIKLNVKKIKLDDKYFKVLFFSLLISGVMLALFYVPFLINIGQNTLSYWSGRISGDVSAKLSSSRYLFTVYQPIYVVHFYTLLFAAGVAFYLSSLIKYLVTKKLPKLKKLFFLIPEFNFGYNKTFFIFLWFCLAFGLLEGLVYIPGTHIYTYLIPLTIIMAFGIVLIEKFLELFKKLIHPKVISYAGILALFAFIYLQSYAIFVDNRQEYPWENEKFYIWEFNMPTPIYHLSMFGFPYYRNWEGISNVIISSENNGYYSTNERSSIARYYVPLEKSTDDAGYYVHILNPQSFTNKIQQDKAQYWAQRYHPVFTFSRNGDDLVRVYNMEPGELEEIVAKGY